MSGEFISMKQARKVATMLMGILFCSVAIARGQTPNEADCVVSQNGVCLDAVIQNTPPAPAAPAKPAPVTYKKGRLTITSDGTSLRDILNAVSSQTGVDIVLPQQGLEEQVVAHLGPGPMRDVLIELLNGSSFNYVMLASAEEPTILQHLILTSRNTMPSPVAVAAAPPPEPAETGSALYGQGFSTDPNEQGNSGEADAQQTSNAEWAAKQGQIIDQMQKARIKQHEQEEMQQLQQQLQQQQQQQQQPAPQPE